MPTFELSASGKTFEIEAPDQGAAVSAFQKMQADQPSTAGDVAKSAGIGVAKGGIGIGGVVGDLSDLMTKGTNAATNFVERQFGMPETTPKERISSIKDYIPDAVAKAAIAVPTSAQIQKGIEDNVTGKFYEPQTPAGKYAQTVGEFAGSSILGPGRVGAKLLTSIPAGLGSEAAGQATEGSKAEPYARVLGALLGGFSPGVARRAVTPLPATEARQRLVDVLANEGVTSVSAGQRTGNKSLQYMESFLGDAPGAGGQASRVQQEGQRQFTEAAMRRAGAGPDAGPETLRNNNQRLGNEFDRLAANNNLTPDNQFITDLTGAVRDYRNVPNSQQRALVQGYVDDIIDHVNTGSMPGPQYQEMRSRLSRQSNSLRNSDPTLSDALRDTRNALDEAMGRSIAPADQEAWQTARREYGAQKTIEKAASRAGEATAEGQVVPANLRNAVSAENRGAYARGEGQFSELARAGSGVMAPLPNSGTAQRMSIWGLLNDATLGAVPAVGGRAIMSRPVQAYLGNQILSGDFANLPPGRQAVLLSLLGQDRTKLEHNP